MKSKDRLVDVFRARVSLDTAQLVGGFFKREVDLMSRIDSGYKLTDVEKKRLEAYERISGLSKDDVTKDNFKQVMRDIRIIQSGTSEKPPICRFPTKKNLAYKCKKCHMDVPAYELVYPDGTIVDSLMEHEKHYHRHC